MLYSCCIETLISACRDPYKFCLYCPATHVTSQVLQAKTVNKWYRGSHAVISVHNKLFSSFVSFKYLCRLLIVIREKQIKGRFIVDIRKHIPYFSSTNCLFTSLVQIVSLLLVPLFKKRIFANTKTCWKSNLNGNVENACLK